MLLHWILAGLSVASALLYGFHFVHQPASTLRTICKAIPVSALAALAALSGAPWSLSTALALGALGDVFLSRDGERNFMAGLGAFLFGHLCYLVLLAQAGGGVDLVLQEPWRVVAGVGLLGSTILIMRRLLPHLGALRAAVLIYAAVIVMMGLTALALPLLWPLALAIPGALLFIASDAILGFQVFVVKDAAAKRRATSSLLWFLYWGGQLLILLAFVLR